MQSSMLNVLTNSLLPVSFKGVYWLFRPARDLFQYPLRACVVLDYLLLYFLEFFGCWVTGSSLQAFWLREETT